MVRVNPPELLDRYAVERRGLILAMITQNLIAAIMVGLFSRSPYEWLMYIPFAWAFTWTIFPLQSLLSLRQEEKLAAQHRLEGFTLSDTSLRCNIALTQGDLRRRLIFSSRGILELPLENIRRLIVHPERVLKSHEPQHKRMQHVIPGYYELELTQDAMQIAMLGDVALERAQIPSKLLAAHELDILNFLQTRTLVRVEKRER